MLKVKFETIAQKYASDRSKISLLWDELEDHYLKEDRYYHNLTHIIFMIDQLTPLFKQIKDWDVLMLAVFYHDIVYNSLKRNNEEKSARLAASRLRDMGLGKDQVERCSEMIIATKYHKLSSDEDTNFLLDADLAILGADAEHYKDYTEQVRKEYRYYPDLVYKPGRRKVLDHFLSMPRIYKTDHFYNKYEDHARRNMSLELRSL